MFFGHGAVVGTHSRLDVDERGAGTVGGERSGDSRVGVALNNHRCWADIEQQCLDSQRGEANLCAARLAADLEVQLWGSELELFEKQLAHVVVEVLAGVHDERPFTKPVDDRCELDDLRSRADDDCDALAGHARTAAWTAATIWSHSDSVRCWCTGRLTTSVATLVAVAWPPSITTRG